MLPDAIVALLEEAFPNAPVADVVPTVGGFSHRTLALTIGGRRCVLKAAEVQAKRADLRREARVLGLLQGSGLPAPGLIALLEDAAWTVTVMEHIAGVNALAFYSGQPELLEDVAGALGRLLAAVHRLPLRVDAPDLRLAARFRELRARLPELDLDPEIAALLAESLEHPIWQQQALSLVHGDAGIHNLLWDNGVAALLDWEWAGIGCPLLDLAWIAWTLRWRQAPAALWPALLRAYGDGPARRDEGDPDTLRALIFGQIASILTRVADIPEARAEWLRRIRWTQTQPSFALEPYQAGR